MSDYCLILSNSLAHTLMFHYSQQVAVAIVDWKVIKLVFFDQLWRMSVEGANAVAGQELKDPLGQPASPAQPGASQKWAFPLTALCALQCAPCSCSHFFCEVITLFSITEMRHCIDFNIAGSLMRKATLSSTRGLEILLTFSRPGLYKILHWVLNYYYHYSSKLQRRSGEWRGWIY